MNIYNIHRTTTIKIKIKAAKYYEYNLNILREEDSHIVE